MNALLKVILNGAILNRADENSIIIGRGCPIDASVVLGVTAMSSGAKLKLKTIQILLMLEMVLIVIKKHFN